MKILASNNKNSYYIRIVDSVDENLISEFLRYKKSYIAAYNPFLDIEGPDSECDEVIDFLYDNGLAFRVY
jgi:hypothetical protein